MGPHDQTGLHLQAFCPRGCDCRFEPPELYTPATQPGTRNSQTTGTTAAEASPRAAARERLSTGRGLCG